MRIRPTKPSSVLGGILSKLFTGTQQCLDASKSMGSKFIFECVCTQLPQICGFHFLETGLLYPTSHAAEQRRHTSAVPCRSRPNIYTNRHKHYNYIKEEHCNKRLASSSELFIAKQPSLCRVAVVAFYNDRNSKPSWESKEYEENGDHHRDQCSIAADIFCAQRMRIPAGEGRRANIRPTNRRANIRPTNR